MHEMSTGISGIACADGLIDWKDYYAKKQVDKSYKAPWETDTQDTANNVATPMNSGRGLGADAFGYVQDGNGGFTELNKVEYDAINSAGGAGDLKYGQYLGDNAGGTGTFGYIQDGNGGMIGLDANAYNAIKDAGGAGDLKYGAIGESASDTGWDSMKGKGGLALGGLNFGLGLAGFLDQKKTAKLQRGLMQQQLASNTETMANKRADRAHIKSVFGGGTATSGLKAV